MHLSQIQSVFPGLWFVQVRKLCSLELMASFGWSCRADLEKERTDRCRADGSPGATDAFEKE